MIVGNEFFNLESLQNTHILKPRWTAYSLILQIFQLRKHMCSKKSAITELIKLLFEKPESPKRYGSFFLHNSVESKKNWNLSKPFNTFRDYPVIVLSFILYAGSLLPLLRILLCCNITPSGHDGDWIENCGYFHLGFLGIFKSSRKKNCEQWFGLKVKVKR